MSRRRKTAQAVLAWAVVLLVFGCGAAPATPTVAPTPIVTAEPSGAPADWLAAVCAARDAVMSRDVPSLIRAVSGLDAVAWPAGEVVREPLRRALDDIIKQERDGDIDAGMDALDALTDHSDAAAALFGSAEAMCP